MALASVKLELLTGQAERSAKRLQDKTKELSNRFREINKELQASDYADNTYIQKREIHELFMNPDKRQELRAQEIDVNLEDQLK